MKPKMKKIIRILAFMAIAGIIIGGSIIFYMFKMPHRDIQDSDASYFLTTTELVEEYLSNADAANDKYLDEDGDSEILEISGTVLEIGENFDGQKLVLLKDSNDKAGVKCTFLAEASSNAIQLKIGENVTIKGVIRSGAAYDEDLELYEHVVLDKCDLVRNK